LILNSGRDAHRILCMSVLVPLFVTMVVNRLVFITLHGSLPFIIALLNDVAVTVAVSASFRGLVGWSSTATADLLLCAQGFPQYISCKVCIQHVNAPAGVS